MVHPQQRQIHKYGGVDDTETAINPEAEIADAGWYPDPEDPSSLRHWNGGGWSESLFDDITSVAVLESRDPGLFLDEVDQPARVALPRSEDDDGASASESDSMPPLGERSPWTGAQPPRRNTAALIVVGAAALIALVAVGAIVAQFIGGDGGSDETSTASGSVDESVDSIPADSEAPPSEPPAEPVQAAQSSAAEIDTAPPPPAADPTVAAVPEQLVGPLLSSTEVSLLVETARVRSDPNLDSENLTTLERSVTPIVPAIGDPVAGWRAIEGTGGWVWGAFLAPAAEGYLVAHTVDDTAAVLRDEAGVPTGAPSFGGSYILIIDGSTELWQIILPEGGFAYVDGAEFELVLS